MLVTLWQAKTMETRVGTVIFADSCVNRNRRTFELQGFCFDIWNRLSKELNISSKWYFATDWHNLFQLFDNDKIDVIVERIDES